MNILIFKTDIDCERRFNYVNYLFTNHPQIFQWTVDSKDVDKVLRVESSENITESDVIQLLRRIGIYCEEL
ncbi:hypothetical protein QQ020_30075 [Fulvivirgaceae bacterium BMA12]|uniref:Uncharacterized protein n=1 Tax=Agaribacillus aureus TaxID=3051825 RepID=A0ABT8LEZ2_9BACT|nr:hypothetical protein [Fulvivirgaceae bacterium BMA12]